MHLPTRKVHITVNFSTTGKQGTFYFAAIFGWIYPKRGIVREIGRFDILSRFIEEIMEMDLEVIRSAVAGNAAAFRSVSQLQPIGGVGDKVFPATYAGGVYAREKRRRDSGDSTSELVECVLLDSVASQANRAEEALLRAIRAGKIELPLIEVDFAQANESLRVPLPNLTSLEVPHRLADAILRDSLLDDGTPFFRSDFATDWKRANLWYATPIYRICPTALLFGMWGSPEKPGGVGAKFERAFVSEMVGVDVCPAAEKRTGFRIDPISASSKVGVLPREDGGFDVAESAKTKGAVRPSEVNHSNILYESSNTGVRFAYAEQTTVISLGALRKLHFPVDGRKESELDDAGRTVLAALGLCAGILAAERGTSLRSRCHLWPVGDRTWELLDRPGQKPVSLTMTGEEAISLLNGAVAAAERVGLSWRKEVIRLKPSAELIKLISQSQEIQAKEGEEDAA